MFDVSFRLREVETCRSSSVYSCLSGCSHLSGMAHLTTVPPLYRTQRVPLSCSLVCHTVLPGTLFCDCTSSVSSFSCTISLVSAEVSRHGLASCWISVSLPHPHLQQILLLLHSHFHFERQGSRSRRECKIALGGSSVHETLRLSLV